MTNVSLINKKDDNYVDTRGSTVVKKVTSLSKYLLIVGEKSHLATQGRTIILSFVLLFIFFTCFYVTYLL